MTQRTVVDVVSAPASYDDMHRQYFGYIVQLVRNQGIEQQGAEDVASEIFFRLMVTDILAQFDPDMTFTRGGEVKTARFKSFLNAKVMHYVRHYRDRQTVLHRREPIICDATLGEDGAAWIDVFGPTAEDDYGSLELQDYVDRATEYLRQVPRRSPKDICDLAALFEAVVGQVRLTGRVNREELEGVFGISGSAVSSWVQLLRLHLREFADQ